MGQVDIYGMREVKIGIASTLKSDKLRGPYSDAVEKFIYDNLSIRNSEKWQGRILELLINPIEEGSSGENLRYSTPYTLAFMQERVLGINLIPLKELRGVYERAGHKNPFLGYVETGIALIGQEKTGFEQTNYSAKKIYKDLTERGIDASEGVVLDFNQLRLEADHKRGLVFRLNEDANKGNIRPLRDYSWEYDSEEEGGLFRVGLSEGSRWVMNVDNLERLFPSYEVVVFSPEGSVLRKSSAKELGNETKQRLSKFRKGI